MGQLPVNEHIPAPPVGYTILHLPEFLKLCVVSGGAGVCSSHVERWSNSSSMFLLEVAKMPMVLP